MISAIIITKNEERNIERCIASLKGVADEIIVVDSGSTDNTEAICRDTGVHFEYHKWEGYANQKNYANSLATHEWTLSIDADEALSDSLRDAILQLKQESFKSNVVYAVQRLNSYCGQWIKHGGWYPDQKIRLWKSGTAHWDGAVHEDLSFESPVNTVLLEGKLLHYTYNSFNELAERQASYARLAAQKAFENGKRCGWLAPHIHPRWTFLRNYLLKGGFLDGAAGYIISRMSAYYTFMKYTILREFIKSNNHTSCQKGK